MGYGLQSIVSGQMFDLTGASWRRLLDLAAEWGWSHPGTKHPPQWDDHELGPDRGQEWCGSYFLNEGQVVEDADARALADALGQVLDSLPCRVRGEAAAFIRLPAGRFYHLVGRAR